MKTADSMWERFVSSSEGHLSFGLAVAVLPLLVEIARRGAGSPVAAAGLLLASVVTLVLAGVMMLLPAQDPTPVHVTREERSPRRRG